MKLRKIVLALAALGASSTALAGTIDSTCAGDNVTVGCEQTGWQVGAKYLYVQPTGDQLYSNLNSQSKWASGFELNAAYLFGEGKDVSIQWIYFSKTSKRAVQPFNSLLDPFIPTDRTLVNLSDSAEQLKNKFNAVNLEFGQTAYWGTQVTTRLHAGLQYASINRDHSQFNQVAGLPAQEPTILINSNLRYKQTFKGVGPRIGLDTAYAIGDSNLSVVGKGAVAVLAGTSKVSKNSTSVGTYSTVLQKGETVVENMSNQRTRMVTPALDAKLGLQYDVSLAAGTLVVEAGYQWVNYLQALKTPVNQLPELNNSRHLNFDPTSLGIPGSQNNFGYHGFYAGLKWQGDLS